MLVCDPLSLQCSLAASFHLNHLITSLAESIECQIHNLLNYYYIYFTCFEKESHLNYNINL